MKGSLKATSVPSGAMSTRSNASTRSLRKAACAQPGWAVSSTARWSVFCISTLDRRRDREKDRQTHTEQHGMVTSISELLPGMGLTPQGKGENCFSLCELSPPPWLVFPKQLFCTDSSKPLGLLGFLLGCAGWGMKGHSSDTHGVMWTPLGKCSGRLWWLLSAGQAAPCSFTDATCGFLLTPTAETRGGAPYLPKQRQKGPSWEPCPQMSSMDWGWQNKVKINRLRKWCFL